MVKLLQNDLPTVPHLDHGWFGLRNRIPAEAHITDAERDEREIKEFAQPAWEGVGKDRTGIHSLIKYVDKERRAQIQSGLPQIIAEIRRKLHDCESDLGRMGEARDSPKAQRYFIFQFCNEMQKMANASLIGQYHDIPQHRNRRSEAGLPRESKCLQLPMASEVELSSGSRSYIPLMSRWMIPAS